MPKWVPHIPISTLCSKRLQPSDCIDISGQSRPRLMLPCGSTYLFYPNTTLATDVFPPNTRGFLYYHTPPKAPPLVGGLHFRCASNLDDFHKGKDLVLKDNFTPWSIPLYSLANHVTYAKWCEQLMLDHLVTQAALDKWIAAKTVVGDALKRRVGRDRPVLYYLTQPFILHFNTHKISFFTATKDEIGGCLVHNPLKDPYPRNFLPYGGVGLVRFEPYINAQRPKQDQVALRVLKIIEPVKTLLEDYDGYLHHPAEGALIQRSNVKFPVVSFRMNQSLKGAAILPLNFDDLS